MMMIKNCYGENSLHYSNFSKQAELACYLLIVLIDFVGEHLLYYLNASL
ncbi:hypothetical protein EPYR_03017 [Erwinia pyrifoliae DSM 12163]|nr:hypothetical protein EPYR_03017 [Erwinia pyrifoliae DSM 12163]